MRRYQNILSIIPGGVTDSLFHEGSLSADAGNEILNCWADLEAPMEETDDLGGLQYLEVRSSLPDELLMYADKLSMAHGLELRVPYLDQTIVQFAERLPARFKVRGRSQKWLHRSVARSYLPDTIINRKKGGFADTVVDSWFRGALTGRMADTFLDGQSKMYRYVKPEAVRVLYNAHVSGQRDNHKILFSLIMFEEWLRVH